MAVFEWIKKNDNKIYPITHAKGVIRGSSTVDDDLKTLEEKIVSGNWTPTSQDESSASLTNGTYTKVGNVVTCSCAVNWVDGCDGFSISKSSLPFVNNGFISGSVSLSGDLSSTSINSVALTYIGNRQEITTSESITIQPRVEYNVVFQYISNN